MIRDELYVNDRTGVVVYEKNGEIVKEYKDTTLYPVSSELAMCSTNWHGAIQGPLRFEYIKSQRVFRIYMKEGEKVTTFDDRDVVELIRYLAVMEAHGLIHADIKMENVVRIDGNVCMIDYGLLTGRSDRFTPVQTIKDMWGEAVSEGYVIPASDHNALSAAMYALGVTICLGKGLMSWSDGYTDISFECNGCQLEVGISDLFEYTVKNFDSLCQSLPILTNLICTPTFRAKSFWQLLDVKETREMYDRMAATTCVCEDIAMCIQGYYMYGSTCVNTLVELTGGKCMFWFDNESPSLRLLREYNEPGTWFIPIQPCTKLSELAEHILPQSPSTIVYSFEGGRTSRITKEKLLALRH